MMRLDRFLSEATPDSRSEARKHIRSGCVSVNGQPVRSPDVRIDEKSDRIQVDGRDIVYRKFIYLMLNKPGGYLSAVEDARDPVVTDLVPEHLRHFRVFPVGRLDKDTEGLLLLTNDGQFDHALMSPARKVVKRYEALLDRPAAPDDVEAFRRGMTFSDFTAAPATLEIDEKDPCRVVIGISEGKFHQVKRMCRQIGKTVLFLKRTAIGLLKLDETLGPGEIRELTDEEIRLLLPPRSASGDKDNAPAPDDVRS